ncbi:alkylhydroperoxidase family enzyme [Paraburkholderia sp. MM5384-R2]|nr:alkylhydroperoxidase family enzyme [Paraburkholderia sp. MM5384-R2]
MPDTVWDAVKPHFSEQEISDLTPLIIAINGWNRIAVPFRKMPE